MKKKTNNLIAGIITIIVCILAIIFAQKISVPVIRTIVTLAIIIAAILLIVMGGILIFANKSSQEKSAVSDSETAKKKLTQEQTASINNAFTQLTAVKMDLAKIKDTAIVQSGNDACSSIEKVLRTLKEKPEKIQTSRQLFNYYLPTMEKVMSKYQTLEKSEIDNADMPAKVSGYLGSVRSAMDNLYEGLFDNDKLNIEVDMEAMKLAIKRDGLLDDDEI